MPSSKKVQVIRTGEEKKMLERETKERIKCPLCGGAPKLVSTYDYNYNFYTCSLCDCDYKIRR